MDNGENRRTQLYMLEEQERNHTTESTVENTENTEEQERNQRTESTGENRENLRTQKTAGE